MYISVSPFVLQTSYGLSAQHLSLLFGINALGPAGMGQLSARLVDRVGPRALLMIGVVAIAAAATSLPAVVFWNIGLAGIVPAFFVISASLGLIAQNATALALATTTPRMVGSASALLGVIQLSISAIIAPLVTFIVLCRPDRFDRLLV